ncbi:archease [Candidatus Woesearchaeota archaeon]|nr:archease [Candidatus Woesearchaeota archaeon]
MVRKKKRFEYLEHTADAKFKAYGKTDEERFENAALAMFNIVINTEKIREVEMHTLEIKAKNLRGLLYDFLDELLYLHDVEGFVLAKVKKVVIEENTLKATVTGDKYQGYEIRGHIKAVTYNDFEYTKNYVVMVMDL